MPSFKTKKRTKKPLDSINSISQSTPPPSKIEINEDDVLGLLQEAAIKFPSLISKDAFIGKLASVQPYSDSSHTAKIWLSESAIIASSIIQDSVVSVSLAPPQRKPDNGFPLYSFMNNYVKQYGSYAQDRRTNEAGTYFALAVVSSSSKVSNNEVQLSWSLSCTMGNPAPGMTTFVFPIQHHSMVGVHNDIRNGCPGDISASSLTFWNCKDMYMELLPSKNEVKINDDTISTSNSKSDLDHRNHENGVSSSPKTPSSYQSKLNHTSDNDLSLRRCQKLVSSSVCPSNSTLFATYDIKSALEDKVSKEILEVLAFHWLCGRRLFRGNFVAVPFHKEIFFFLLEGVRCPMKDDSMSIVNHALSLHEVQTVNEEHRNTAFVVGCGTKVHLSSSLRPAEEDFPSVDLEFRYPNDKETCHFPKLGGLSYEFDILKEIIDSFVVNHFLSSVGLRNTKGVLLHGPPGTGKTSLALSCINDAGVNLFSINGPELIGQFFGESEQALHEVFNSASEAAPAVVFIDELDAIAPARKSGGEDLSERIVGTLLPLMDGICTSDGILIIAATNKLDSIDPALRRRGRFDREIEIGVPSSKQRLDILQVLLSEMSHSLQDIQVQELAASLHGFVGADITALCNEAAKVCLRRYLKLRKTSDSSSRTVDGVQFKESSTRCNSDSDDLLGESDLSDGTTYANHEDSMRPSSSCPSTDKVAVKAEENFLEVTFNDFQRAKRKVRPSAMREVMLEIPKVRWEDVGGQLEVKKQLMEAVEWPQKHEDTFKRIGVCPPSGILLFGPPGCSKTLMARAIASEAGLNFLAVKGPELLSKWVGESEKAVRSLFAKAQAVAPSVIFFDEIDGLAIVRGKESDGSSVGIKVVAGLARELDGLHERGNVVVIAATNRPDKVDHALLRQGRFNRLLYVGPPNEMDREDIFRIHVRNKPCGPDVNIKELAHLTQGYTGADISLICHEAAIAAMEESLDASVLSMTHFKIGIERVKPLDIHSYQEFSSKFERLVCSGVKLDNKEHQPFNSSGGSFTFWTGLKSLLRPLFLSSSST